MLVLPLPAADPVSAHGSRRDPADRERLDMTATGGAALTVPAIPAHYTREPSTGEYVT
jgi:hypothetical protein